ncbi:multidrug-resistance type transporter aminotriazole resistance [Friedmanniomyces endolithicus]|uniref:Multidrug-resistance type transporter aminotriazole resistance n=1 Tax=Friedmanniomyces endolithicus TaxID=329885 RepID=A0AAN6JXF2_9PEZI|nr:multidrug-resistance type transporter aminotriazole resistance [Friedmanniomyces endolithicus]KAK0952146.1 multidrug-resistance type transporter aminotriazole resistance [Friedmanniomyces endolithicus]KAK0952783.1 multidrug-resistance type transporter aminotriazole resistance [Friedmanniomyces endolithicus]KAK1022250.1 multidrug-resistance type transporter aminotriazole resistance [Friedmanniomyces endolithicus]
MQRTHTLSKDVSAAREVLIIALICLAQLTTQVGFGQAVAILNVVGDDFGIDNPGVKSWLVAGYSLTVGSFILISGRLGDVYGYKRMLVFGYSWFALWSIVYSSYVLYIFARVLQGVGPAICMPNGLALLGALYEPGNKKNFAFAIFGALAPVGSIIGAVFADVFALAWWPWTYWSFAIVLAVIAGVVEVAMPDPQDLAPRPDTLKRIVEELDLLAAAVGVGSLIVFNFAWNQAPIAGWSSGYIIACLVLGVLLVPLFFFLELKVSTHPLIPFSVLTSTNAFVLGCIACGWAEFGIFFYYLWVILLNLRKCSPLLAAAYLTPLIITGSLAAGSTGYLLSRLRPAWLMVIAMAAFLVGNLLIATLPVHQIYWGQIFVATVVSPFGMDMSFPAATIYLSNTIEKERQGVAASLVNTIVNYSISLGLGFVATVEIHVSRGDGSFEDTPKGYRGALFIGTGLAGLGLILRSRS